MNIVIHDCVDSIADQGVWQIKSLTIMSGTGTIHFLFSSCC